MKPVRAKIHLLDVDEPLLAYHNLTVRCGLILNQAEPKFMTSEDLEPVLIIRDDESSAVVRRPDCCQKCVDMRPKGAAKRHYTYGLMEGQAALDAGRERENLEIMV